MPYPKSFHRLVIFGTLYNDIWNTSLNILPSGLGEALMPPVTTNQLDSVATIVNTGWWQKSLATGGFPGTGYCQLEGIKLNRINAAGKYEDPKSMTFLYPGPIGANGGDYKVAPQLTTVATLRTAIPRGRGSKGRMYLPPVKQAAALGTDGRMTAAGALEVATSVKTLIEALNGYYVAIGRVGVASNVASGRFEHATKVTCGRVVDTMRTRRNKQLEDPSSVDIALI